MNVKFKFDMRRLEKAIKDLRPHVRKTRAELVEDAAKGFVKRVVAITPPASKGVSGSKAKQQGDQAIKSDLARIMVAAARKSERDTRAAAASPEELHRRFRDKRTGRINPGALKRPYRVGKTELLALQRRLLKEVGWLAAGWNEAAKKLGVRLPAWVARHGSGRGSIGISNGATRFRITIANEVGFVGNVKGFSRRIQSAINLQANAMKRQAEHLLKKGIRKAGWK
jgi:hypothetical protein